MAKLYLKIFTDTRRSYNKDLPYGVRGHREILTEFHFDEKDKGRAIHLIFSYDKKTKQAKVKIHRNRNLDVPIEIV